MLHTTLLLSGKLNSHLVKIDNRAVEIFLPISYTAKNYYAAGDITLRLRFLLLFRYINMVLLFYIVFDRVNY